jgi:hypothetical protein
MDVTFCKCNYHSFTLYLPYASLHHTLLDGCKYLMMLSYLRQMVRTGAIEEQLLDIQESSTRHGRGQAPRGNAPPLIPRPPVSLEQLLMMQNELMRMLMENEARHGAGRLQYPR